MPFYKVIFDKRFGGSCVFANCAAQAGAPTLGITGDVTSIWYSDLSERLKESPAAIAGVTLNGALFCLDALVRPYGMRVVYRSERPGRHRLDAGDEAWGIETASVLTRVAERSRDVMPRALSVDHLVGPGGPTDTLVSWVIVPGGARLVSRKTF
jgi:hypothetical protein